MSQFFFIVFFFGQSGSSSFVFKSYLPILESGLCPIADVQGKLVTGFHVVGTCSSIFKREISLSFPSTVDQAYFLEK